MMNMKEEFRFILTMPYRLWISEGKLLAVLLPLLALLFFGCWLYLIGSALGAYGYELISFLKAHGILVKLAA